MAYYLGIDTSNYTTSVALIDDNFSILQEKKLLPVKSGQKGLRQSDAVFHHTKQLPELIERLFKERNINPVAVGVSSRPTTVDGSYMPCFLVGENIARSIGAVMNVPVFRTSHQVGHILAGVISSNEFKLLENPFLAFHVSGGTTDCLLCTPSRENILDISMVSTSLDLKGGQAIDRVGISLGLNFPCGKELEKLALKSTKSFKVKPTLKDGNCCLSGLENLCNKMLSDNQPFEDISLFCLEYIYQTVKGMTSYALNRFGKMPLLYVGGVMSNSIIREKLSNDFNCYFAQPTLSCDNAVGISLYALKKFTSI
ncbi:MAG: peptidase M22 [Oscillospiraceae bacterium]